MRLAIFGTGGMGRELADIVRRSPRLGARYASMVFVVDQPQGSVQDIEVIAPDDLSPDDELCLAIGSSPDRRRLADRFAGQPMATIISDHALVSPTARIGRGAMICDFAVINNASIIGDHFLANSYAQVSHDCVIDDYVTLSPKASCNGWVHIEDEVSIGAGAVIRNGSAGQRLRIGRKAVIGMGAIVPKDVRPETVVLGAAPRRT